MRRCAALALATSGLLMLSAGCTGATRDDADRPESAASAALEPSRPTVVQGMFAAYTPGATAVTYDPKLVPPGSEAHLSIAAVADSTTVTLRVSGLVPNHDYGVHLHTMPCGADAAMAGPHYQHQPDPAASASPPSTNPAYDNPQNEVWLDLRTNVQGIGHSRSTQPWRFSTPARSMVIHAKRTQAADGMAGMAGTRLACLTL